MVKILVVALSAACAVNVACLFGHLYARGDSAVAASGWLAAPARVTIASAADR